MDLKALARTRLHEQQERQDRESRRMCDSAAAALVDLLFPQRHADAEQRHALQRELQVRRTGADTVEVACQGLVLVGRRAAAQIARCWETWTWRTTVGGEERQILSLAHLGAALEGTDVPEWA